MPLRDTLLALLVAVIWGFNFVVMKVGVAEIPPFMITGLRFVLAAFPAVLLVARPTRGWGTIVAFALLFAVVKFSLLFWALRLGLPAGLTAITLQLQAFFTVALAALVMAERLSRSQAAGIALAALGLGALAIEQLGGARLMPLFMVVAAALFWGLANIVAKRAGGVEPVALVVWSSAVAAPLLLVLSALLEQDAWIRLARDGMSWQAAAAVIYLAYPVTLLSNVVWNGLLRRHAAAKVAPIILLVPVIGALSGNLMLSEPLTSGLIIGGALVIAGLAVEMIATGWRLRRPQGSA